MKQRGPFPECDVIFNYLSYIAVAAVLVVLLAGLWNMMRGGSPNRSQTLMRWRVIRPKLPSRLSGESK